MDTTLGNTHDVHLTCEQYNCKGFKSNVYYILDRLEKCDVLSLEETWLKPHKLNLIQCAIDDRPSMRNSKFHIFSNSGICDVEPTYTGRPFGGVSLIVKSMKGLACYELETSCNDVLPVAISHAKGDMIHILLAPICRFTRLAIVKSISK